MSSDSSDYDASEDGDASVSSIDESSSESIHSSLFLDSENIVDACYVCNGHGELVICERCERGFHTFCVCMDSVPDDDFICTDCATSNISMHRNWDLTQYESFVVFAKRL